MTSSADRRERRRDNGIEALSYVAIVDVDPEIGPDLLDVLKRARIAAYLVSPLVAEQALDRLYVAREERGDARTIVASAMRTIRPDGERDEPPAVRDAIDGDVDSEFAALIADWQVDTVAAIRAAERDLSAEDAEWRARLEPPMEAVWIEDEHYVPPAPPPLPRLAGVTIGALLLLFASILVLALGARLGVDGDFAFLVGVCGILVSAGMLIMRLRDRPDDDEDDGAVL